MRGRAYLSPLVGTGTVDHRRPLLADVVGDRLPPGAWWSAVGHPGQGRALVFVWAPAAVHRDLGRRPELRAAAPLVSGPAEWRAALDAPPAETVGAWVGRPLRGRTRRAQLGEVLNEHLRAQKDAGDGRAQWQKVYWLGEVF